jgi:tight adherence protein B
MNALPILVFVLSAGCVGGVLLAALYPRLIHGSALDRKIELIATGPSPATRQAGAGATRRKRTVEATLLEDEELERAKAKKRYKPSLVMRLRQANLGWSKSTYQLVSLAVGAVMVLAALVGLRLDVLPAAGLGLAAGLLLPRLFVGFKRGRRFKRFRAEFPNAIDVIVRGLKSGLPLNDCLKIVAAESSEPVRGEFKTMVEDQTLGMPLAEAAQRLPNRMPLAEANFFTVAIVVQSTSGGNLAEALGNLSKVLRERKKMQGKISAMSAEAKASGGIIGSLPIIVGGLIYLTSPPYITILFTSTAGNIVLAVSAVWMLIGVVTMRQMINFDF